MKKAFTYIAYPLTLLLSVALNTALFCIEPLFGLTFMYLLSGVIYVLLGGFAISKIDSKRARKIIIAIMAVIAMAAGVICYINTDMHSDTWGFYSLFISPLGGIVINYMIGVISSEILCAVIAAVAFTIPIIISYISSLVFRLDNKKVKRVLAASFALICAVSLGGSVFAFIQEMI